MCVSLPFLLDDGEYCRRVTFVCASPPRAFCAHEVMERAKICLAPVKYYEALNLNMHVALFLIFLPSRGRFPGIKLVELR